MTDLPYTDADGLTPDRHIVYRDDQGKAFAAVHFAFDPSVVKVEEVREALTEAIRRGLGYTPA